MFKVFSILDDGDETEMPVFDPRFTPPNGRRIKGWRSADGEWAYDSYNDTFHRRYDPDRKLEDYYKI